MESILGRSSAWPPTASCCSSWRTSTTPTRPRAASSVRCRPWDARCPSASCSATSRGCPAPPPPGPRAGGLAGRRPGPSTTWPSTRSRPATSSSSSRRPPEGGVRSSLLPSIVEGARGNPLMALWLASSAEVLAGVRLSDPFDEVIGARLEALPPRGRPRRPRARRRAPAAAALGRSCGSSCPTVGVTIQGLEAAIESGFVVEARDERLPSRTSCSRRPSRPWS